MLTTGTTRFLIQVGPRIREGVSEDRYLDNLESRPPAEVSTTAAGNQPPGYPPQKMMGMEIDSEFMRAISNRREVQGMRATWPIASRTDDALSRIAGRPLPSSDGDGGGDSERRHLAESFGGLESRRITSGPQA